MGHLAKKVSRLLLMMITKADYEFVSLVMWQVKRKLVGQQLDLLAFRALADSGKLMVGYLR